MTLVHQLASHNRLEFLEGSEYVLYFPKIHSSQKLSQCELERQWFGAGFHGGTVNLCFPVVNKNTESQEGSYYIKSIIE